MKRAAFAILASGIVLIGDLAPHTSLAEPVTATAAPTTVFDAAAKRQAIAAAARLLIDNYVFPDMGVKAATLLTQNLAAGKYDSATTYANFAERLTKDLQDLTHDKHLHVMADTQPRPLAPAGPPPSMGLYQFMQADRLKGNIGYIVLNGFMLKKDSRQGADKVMALLASTDALIIDIRGNGGGDPAAVSYLVSFFFDGKAPVHVNDLLWRKPGTADYDRSVFSTEATPVSYLNKPVFLITGPGTFSGGEEFAYDMQTLRRATLVGETTGGGANPGGVEPIGPGLSMFVPSGKAENPITHTNWEGTGVHPDVGTAAAQSFAATYALASKALGHPAAADTPDAVTEACLLSPPRATPAPGSESALRKWEAGMVDGRPPYDMMSDDFATETKNDLSFLQADIGRRGTLQSLTFAEVELSGADAYDAKFTDGSKIRFTIALGVDGKIIRIWGQPY